MSPLEFMQRLAALVPRPRLHLIRLHGVLAPNAKLRAQVVPQENRRDGRCQPAARRTGNFTGVSIQLTFLPGAEMMKKIQAETGGGSRSCPINPHLGRFCRCRYQRTTTIALRVTR